MKKNLLGAGVVAAALVLAGCSAAAPEPAPENPEDGLVIGGELIAESELLTEARSEGTLIFYTGGSAQSEEALAAQFTEDTGIAVEIVRLPPNRLNERILSEVGADQLGADLIRMTGEDLVIGIAEAGAFTQSELPERFELLEGSIIDDGLYYRSADRAYSFAYNNQIVVEADAPRDWDDLLDPQWDGKLGIVQVDGGGSTTSLTRFMFEELGEKYLRGFAAQSPRIFDSSGALSEALARGEITVGTMPIATGYSAILEGAPLTIAEPSEGVAAFSSYLGIASSVSRPAAAQVFLNWTFSLRGQNVSASIGDYPVRADAAKPTIGEQELPGVDSGFLWRATPEDLISHTESDSKLWREIFGYFG